MVLFRVALFEQVEQLAEKLPIVSRLSDRRIAQLAECPDHTGEVAGSTPAPPISQAGSGWGGPR